MRCGFLNVFALLFLTEAIHAVTVTVKPEDRIVQGVNTTFMGTVVNATTNTLSWVVVDKHVFKANVTLHNNGSVTIARPAKQNDGKYAVTYETKGQNVNTNLTVINPTVAMNGTSVELQLGTGTKGVVQVIVNVECGDPPEGATADCRNLSCMASGMGNLASGASKYQRCNHTYRCQNNGSWTIQTRTSCSMLICNKPGKWGQNCTQDCGAGCPGDSVKTCFVDGSCSDSSYMGIVPCAAGYVGTLCNEMVTTTPQTTNEPTTSTTTPEGAESTGATDGTTTASTAMTTPESITAEATTTTPTSLPSCDETPTPDSKCSKDVTTTKVEEKCQTNFLIQNCTTTFVCKNTTWIKSGEPECVFINCKEPTSWGPNCMMVCSPGCLKENDTKIVCDDNSGGCMDPVTMFLRVKGDCRENYTGDNCENPICEDCNGGECLAPGYCGNCPKHFEHGKTCRNISLDGFLRGSLPSLFVLAVIVTLLSVASKYYIRMKLKEE